MGRCRCLASALLALLALIAGSASAALKVAEGIETPTRELLVGDLRLLQRLPGSAGDGLEGVITLPAPAPRGYALWAATKSVVLVPCPEGEACAAPGFPLRAGERPREVLVSDTLPGFGYAPGDRSGRRQRSPEALENRLARAGLLLGAIQDALEPPETEPCTRGLEPWPCEGGSPGGIRVSAVALLDFHELCQERIVCRQRGEALLGFLATHFALRTRGDPALLERAIRLARERASAWGALGLPVEELAALRRAAVISRR